MSRPDDRSAATRWNARYAQGQAPVEPSAFVTGQAGRLPPRGRALDVAGGAGRHAIWLAGQGLTTTLLDISEVALRIAGQRARAAGVTLRVLQRDVEAAPLPSGPYDVVVIVAFLDHDVLAQIPDVLAPGGLLLFAQPTTVNLQRHDNPPRRFLLEPGEMARTVDRLGLTIVELTEGWTPSGSHLAGLVARAPT